MASTSSLVRVSVSTRPARGRAVRGRRLLQTNRASLTPPPGLAFTTDGNFLDPEEAATVAGLGNDEAHARKLREAFSATEGIVVGAFARVDKESNSDATQKNRRFPGSSLVQMGFDLIAGEGDVEGKKLVGYARAATDGSMVATVDDVVVDTKYRKRGIGRRLVSKLYAELRNREIYDVGARVPESAEKFFSKNGFGPDVEGAVLMRLSSDTVETNYGDAFDPKRQLKVEKVRECLLLAMEKADDAKDTG